MRRVGFGVSYKKVARKIVKTSKNKLYITIIIYCLDSIKKACYTIRV